MNKFYVCETESMQSVITQQHYNEITAGSLKAAKITATHSQFFKNTVLRIFDENKNELSYKKDGKWYDTWNL